MGNDYSLVRWIKQPGGGYRHDYALLERYLDAVLQQQGKPKIVCLYIWDCHCNGGEIPVTGLSPGGEMETIHLPRYSDPQSVELWKPVLAGIRQRLRQRGLEGAMMFGVCGDTIPDREAIGFFKALSPGTPWIVHSHGDAARALSQSLPLGYAVNVWSSRFAEDPAEGRHYGWQRPDLRMHFMRGPHNDDYLVAYRFLAEINVAGQQRGFGRLAPISGRSFPTARGSTWARLPRATLPGGTSISRPRCFPLARAGPSARTASRRCARASRKPRPAFSSKRRCWQRRSTARWPRRCQTILDKRTEAMLRGVNDLVLSPLAFEQYPQNPHGWWQYPCMGASYPWYVESGWQDRSRALFEAAADVQRAIAGK